MKLLVTGGAGFIGSNFLKYILNRRMKRKEHYEITGVIDKLTYAADKKRVTSLKIPLYKLDIATVEWRQVLGMQQPDCIISMAAETHVDSSIDNAHDFIHSNYLGVYRLVQGIREYNSEFGKNVLLIHIGTDEEYGDVKFDSPVKFREDWPLKPNNPYAATKAAADLMIQAMHHTYKDFDYVICRAANNYGPNQHMEKFLPTVIRSILNDEKIPVYGKGENVREWLWVEDFCAGIERILDTYYSNKRHFVLDKIFNFGSGNFRRNIDIVKIILRMMDTSEDLISFVSDRPGHDRRYSVCWDKAHDVLNWQPIIKFEDGLFNVIYDIARRLNLLKKLKKIREHQLVS